MRRIGLIILAALMLALTSIGVAVADHKNTDEHGPPGDPPCERGQAGQHNPNCNDANGNGGGGGHGPPGNPPCEKGKAGQHNPNCPGNGGTTPPPPPEACPDNALELAELDPLLYVCLHLLPADDDTVACPDGAIEVPLELEPLVLACVTLLVDNAPDATALASAHHGGDHGPPGDPPCERGQAGQHNPNCNDANGNGGGGGHGPPGNPPCEKGKAGQHNPNCPGNGGTTPPPPPEACPDNALELAELDPLLYVCLHLLPADDDTVACPDGAIEVPLELDPLVLACVTLLVDNAPNAGALDGAGVLDSVGAVGL